MTTTHRTTVAVQELGVVRTIFVAFPEHVTFTCTDRNARTGEVRGFKYSDSERADVEPELLPWRIHPIGDEYRKDGVPCARRGYGWQNAARRICNAWITNNPDWWKSTGETDAQKIADVAASAGAS